MSDILSWTLIFTSCDVYCLILNGQTADKLERIYSNRCTSTSPDESFITPIITLLCYQLNYSNKLSSLYTRGHNSYIMSEYHHSVHSVASWWFPLHYYIIVCLVSIHCAAHEMFFWFYIYIKYCITTFFFVSFCALYWLPVGDWRRQYWSYIYNSTRNTSLTEPKYFTTYTSLLYGSARWLPDCE